MGRASGARVRGPVAYGPGDRSASVTGAP